MTVAQAIQAKCKEGAKQLGILIDPDKVQTDSLSKLLQNAVKENIDFILVGGSLVSRNQFENCIEICTQQSDIPVLLFPGNHLQVSPKADALLLLSLVSGRNPEYLIGQHIAAAPTIRESKVEVIPTAYLLIDGGKPTAVSYLSNTTPIPVDKPEIAAFTAAAAEMLGMQLCYLEAGSGAMHPVPVDMIREVRKNTAFPIICGGGIRKPEQARLAFEAGADILIIGTALEEDANRLHELAQSRF
jgi:phosphoglycerol geranylgeranyltransferase